jgi:hypothetical protein
MTTNNRFLLRTDDGKMIFTAQISWTYYVKVWPFVSSYTWSMDYSWWFWVYPIFWLHLPTSKLLEIWYQTSSTAGGLYFLDFSSSRVYPTSRSCSFWTSIKWPNILWTSWNYIYIYNMYTNNIHVVDYFSCAILYTTVAPIPAGTYDFSPWGTSTWSLTAMRNTGKVLYNFSLSWTGITFTSSWAYTDIYRHKSYTSDFVVNSWYEYPFEYAYNYIEPPTWLIVTWTGWVTFSDDLIDISWYTTNTWSIVAYTLTKNNPPPLANDVYTWSIDHPAWASDISIIEDLTSEWDYVLKLDFIDKDDEDNIYTYYIPFIYRYDSGYIDPETIEYSFVTSWYSFFENGFSLNNFIPTPYGWTLKFKITQPNGSWTTDVYTVSYWPNEDDGNGYWFDTKVKVTFPYHPVAWVYRVVPIYTYNWVDIYPFGTGANSYNISVAEQEYEPIPIYDEWDTDEDGSISTTEALTALWQSIKNFFVWIWKLFSWLKDLFEAIGEIGNTTEEKDWSFIKSAYAEWYASEMFNNAPEDQGFLWKMYNFIKYALLLLLVVWIVSLFVKRKPWS